LLRRSRPAPQLRRRLLPDLVATRAQPRAILARQRGQAQRRIELLARADEIAALEAVVRGLKRFLGRVAELVGGLREQTIRLEARERGVVRQQQLASVGGTIGADQRRGVI